MELGSETFGEISRKCFFETWEKHGCDTVSKQRTFVNNTRRKLKGGNEDYYRAVYRHAFLFARPPGQKNAALDTASELWRVLFSQNSGMAWATPRYGYWTEAWIAFLNEKWKKSVSKDMWNQIERFARRTVSDEEITFWSEDGAWASVIDEFVLYLKEKRAAATDPDAMDTDEI
jgi:DCN1-like protein 1/2